MMEAFLHRFGLGGLDKKARHMLWMLFVFSILSILYQTSISHQLTASVSRLRAGYHIIFGLVHIFYGVGMYVAWLLFRKETRFKRLQLIAGATGLSVLASLLVALKLNIELDSGRTMVGVNALVIGCVLTLFGMVYSAVTVHFHRTHRQAMGVVVSVGLGGLLVGFCCRWALAGVIGDNTLLVMVAIGAMLATIPNWLSRWGLVALVGMGLALPTIDTQIESHRNIEHRYENFFYQHYMTGAEVDSLASLFNGWSPYAKIDIAEVPGGGKLAGIYNHYITWIFDAKGDARRDLIYGFMAPTDRVLAMAIGGGWPLLSIPVERSQITGVEIDPTVVKFFKENPSYNDNLFHDIKLVQAEGRYALDALEGPFDVIVIDLPGSPATQQENPIEFENYLLTLEAVERMKVLMPEDGVIAAYLLRHQTGTAVSTILASGLYARVLRVPGLRRVRGVGMGRGRGGGQTDAHIVYASRDKAKVDSIVESVQANNNNLIERLTEASDAGGKDKLFSYPVTTDDRPYSRFLAYLQGIRTREMKDSAFGWVLNLSQTMLEVVGGLSFLGIVVGRRLGRRRNRLFFFAIGVGLVMHQLYLYARFRSFFGDPLTTTLAVTLILFSAKTIGSLFADRVVASNRGPWVPLAVTVGLLSATQLGLDYIPFGSTNILLQALVGIGLVAPFGFVAGMYFPVGLMLTGDKGLGMGLALDAAGTFIGFVLFYFLSWHLGISANFWPVLLSYAVATVAAFVRD
jgi:uncharacterized membrane protein YjfL (UPF0719 family)